jgi:hypothetical protein
MSGNQDEMESKSWCSVMCRLEWQFEETKEARAIMDNRGRMSLL